MQAYHEPLESLDEKTRSITRALNSLKEEVEAIDWYNQRVKASKDQALKEIMAHNRDEEIEHACITLLIQIEVRQSSIYPIHRNSGYQ